MSTLSIEQPSYFRAALSNQYNVILLAGSVSFAAALASWTPLVSGLVGEALWLVAGPRLAAFRRRTDAVRELVDSERASGSLLPEYVERIELIEREIKGVAAQCVARPDLSADERAEIARRLRPLFPSVVSVCHTHQRLRRVAVNGRLGELHVELSSLHQALTGETDLGVRASLRRAQTVAERRIKQLEGNEAACRSIEMGIQTLEKSLAYLKECSAGMVTFADLCGEIDAAAAQFMRIGALEAERENELAAGRTSVLPPALV